MAVHKILKMGDPRLFRAVRPVTEFGTDTLEQLIADMYDTMRAAKGAGLAAPQIGVDLQVVVFGSMNPTHATLTGRWSLRRCSSTRSLRPWEM